MASLFEAAGLDRDQKRPLADRLRPQALNEVVGQDHLVADDGNLSRLLRGDSLPSLILWGPPGTGKTTVARLLAGETDLQFDQLSAIFSGVQDLKKVFETARARRLAGQGTLLFVDEIHRFNRAQQDAFLPVMEDGSITLVGATTENPSFALNNALLSRSQVLTFRPLDHASLTELVKRALVEVGRAGALTDAAVDRIAALADGDGRAVISIAETVLSATEREPITPADVDASIEKKAPRYDRNQDEHYNLISALHKSVRGSDPDAALYWFARMLAGGEDPRYIARRVVRMATEDIGLADPHALPQTMAAAETYERLGSPEGELAIAQAILYCASAPKSNAVYTAFKAANRLSKEHGSLMPPKHILNAPTSLMKDEGYGAGYAYDHDAEDGFSGQNYFPDGMPRASLYQPVQRGFEREIQKRLTYWAKLRAERASAPGEENP
ncbi:MAG: replication-associated recombination protein A [Pseudomonadota bacterium]